ncbi:MAG TPA: type VI secretion system-associated FHA domain protein TagH [Acetobacteraceae bacterium]|nr:type VI secretion system-associated FHA domain protein TagH [Acetobacteraceae bacterium]
MPLILKLTGGTERDTRTLKHGTLSIGRAPGNDWVLADPERQMSKTHCVVTAAGGQYVLTDLSTNGVFVNGSHERVPRNGEIALTDGDEFRIGEYVISVTEDLSPVGTAPYVVGHEPQMPGGVQRPDPLASVKPVNPDPIGGDPLDDPFGRMPPPGFVHPISAPVPVLRTSDPFDVAEEDKRLPTADPHDDLFHGLAPAESWQGPSQADNADAPLHVFAAPKAINAPMLDDLDIDALLGDTPPGQPVPVSALPVQQLPAAPPAPIQSAVPQPGQPHAPLRTRSAPTPPAAVAAPGGLPGGLPGGPPVVPADATRVLAAFLEGAGVTGLNLGPDPEAALRAAGAVFREMVEGLRQVLISRAAVKNEFRVEQTMLRARDNNALKFSVTAEDAIGALLQPDRPGYKPPLEAAREAFDDVRSHEMAVMAGVQTALVGLLKRFEPGALERRMQPGAFGNILPAARKARTWELFCDTYKEIAREAEDDFQSVFGREFARAYDAQMRKL